MSELVYKAYKVGGASYLEVQSATLKSLESSIQLALTETQMLIELAALAAQTE